MIFCSLKVVHFEKKNDFLIFVLHYNLLDGFHKYQIYFSIQPEKKSQYKINAFSLLQIWAGNHFAFYTFNKKILLMKVFFKIHFKVQLGSKDFEQTYFNLKLRTKNTIQYQHVFFLFEMCLPKDFWSELYIICNTFNINYI